MAEIGRAEGRCAPSGLRPHCGNARELDRPSYPSRRPQVVKTAITDNVRVGAAAAIAALVACYAGGLRHALVVVAVKANAHLDFFLVHRCTAFFALVVHVALPSIEKARHALGMMFASHITLAIMNTRDNRITAADLREVENTIRTAAYLAGTCFHTTPRENIDEALIALFALRQEFVTTQQTLFAILVDELIAGIEKRKPPI